MLKFMQSVLMQNVLFPLNISPQEGLYGTTSILLEPFNEAKLPAREGRDYSVSIIEEFRCCIQRSNYSHAL